MNFCSHCGEPVRYRIPDGDDRPRYVCGHCGIIHYQNPKLVVGCIPEWEDRILLCCRAIEPKSGKWTLPAGYLEAGESVADGAVRETLEEACADVEIIAPYTLFSLTFVNHVYVIFRARLLSPCYDSGNESSEVRLFSEDEIPWDEMAFEVIRETLTRYFQDRPRGVFPVHTGSIFPPGPHRMDP